MRILLVLLLAAPNALPAAEIRTEPLEPAPIRISIDQLPRPNATQSARKNPQVLPVPENPVLKAPAGFKVTLFAEVPQARWLAITPDGRVLCVSSRTDTIFLLPDENSDGVADTRETFADKHENDLSLPFGMAFADGSFFVANTDRVLRFPYKAGQPRIEGKPQTIAQLPGQGYNQHWTRNLVPAPDGGLFVSVGSESNAGVEAPPRAAVTWISLDGKENRLVASGLRNPVGLAVHPRTGQLYTTVNERDEIGDELVPDYLTAVEQGGFYGWPYTYFRPDLLDPRHVKDGKSARPDLASQTKEPDVLFEAHSAALGLTFYTPGENAKSRFPERYRTGAFVAFRGSWNRSQGTGYKIVYVPFGGDGRPEGHYEDFVTGFLTDPAGPKTWGRPVGVLSHPDGSLLFTEEANGRIYRVSYEGS